MFWLSFIWNLNFVRHVDELFDVHFCFLKLIQNVKQNLKLINSTKTYQIETLEQSHRQTIFSKSHLCSLSRLFNQTIRFLVSSFDSLASQFVSRRVELNETIELLLLKNLYCKKSFENLHAIVFLIFLLEREFRFKQNFEWKHCWRDYCWSQQ